MRSPDDLSLPAHDAVKYDAIMGLIDPVHDAKIADVALRDLVRNGS